MYGAFPTSDSPSALGFAKNLQIAYDELKGK